MERVSLLGQKVLDGRKLTFLKNDKAALEQINRFCTWLSSRHLKHIMFQMKLLFLNALCLPPKKAFS